MGTIGGQTGLGGMGGEPWQGQGEKGAEGTKRLEPGEYPFFVDVTGEVYSPATPLYDQFSTSPLGNLIEEEDDRYVSAREVHHSPLNSPPDKRIVVSTADPQTTSYPPVRSHSIVLSYPSPDPCMNSFEIREILIQRDYMNMRDGNCVAWNFARLLQLAILVENFLERRLVFQNRMIRMAICLGIGI